MMDEMDCINIGVGRIMKRMPAIDDAYSILKSCTLCPRRCGVDRTAGKTGFCGMTDRLRVASASPHFGEEAPLVGRHGSGTIFLSSCNLACIYCQNFELSHLREGEEIGIDDVVGLMLALQSRGCHNVNFVTPTHFAPQIMDCIARARGRGLRVPIVYNCGGYESLEMLRLLEGCVDIYMPDAKYWDASPAGELSAAPDYPDAMRAALREMHRQVGDLIIEDGIAARGLLVRHLVLPGGLSGSMEVVDFLAREISSNTYVNVMDQYRPCHDAHRHPILHKYPDREFIESVRRRARELGLRVDQG